jgi:hypothetical protein
MESSQEYIHGYFEQETDWRKAIADLSCTAEADGVFNYTFFKAKGLKLL